MIFQADSYESSKRSSLHPFDCMSFQKDFLISSSRLTPISTRLISLHIVVAMTIRGIASIPHKSLNDLRFFSIDALMRLSEMRCR